MFRRGTGEKRIQKSRESKGTPRIPQSQHGIVGVMTLPPQPSALRFDFVEHAAASGAGSRLPEFQTGRKARPIRGEAGVFRGAR